MASHVNFTCQLQMLNPTRDIFRTFAGQRRQAIQPRKNETKNPTAGTRQGVRMRRKAYLFTNRTLQYQSPLLTKLPRHTRENTYLLTEEQKDRYFAHSTNEDEGISPHRHRHFDRCEVHPSTCSFGRHAAQLHLSGRRILHRPARQCAKSKTQAEMVQGSSPGGHAQLDL